MKLTLDTDKNRIEFEDGFGKEECKLYSKDGFEKLSDLWLKLSWEQKYSYTFTWLGRPIIQHPEDMIRIQEVIFKEQPDIIIETGVAHGGSLIYYASIMKILGKGRVIGVDIEIREHNRKAIESHPMYDLITLVEGDSVGDEVLTEVENHICEQDKVMVILDSDHSKKHVAAEMEAYHSYVTPGSWMLVQDGIMQMVADCPRGESTWVDDNPVSAIKEFLEKHDDFIVEQPEWLFNESPLSQNITAHPSGWLRKNQ
jgi:cephalosporin hydroxylase